MALASICRNYPSFKQTEKGWLELQYNFAARNQTSTSVVVYSRFFFGNFWLTFFKSIFLFLNKIEFEKKLIFLGGKFFFEGGKFFELFCLFLDEIEIEKK